MNRSLVIILISMIIFCCDALEGENLPDPVPIPVVAIDSLSIEGMSVEFTLRCETPESCWGYHDTETSSTEERLFLTVYGQRMTNDPCLQVMTPIEVQISARAPGPGSYVFEFYNGSETVLDTLIHLED